MYTWGPNKHLALGKCNFVSYPDKSAILDHIRSQISSGSSPLGNSGSATANITRHWRIQGGVRDARPLSVQFLLFFMQVLAKILPNNRFLH